MQQNHTFEYFNEEDPTFFEANIAESHPQYSMEAQYFYECQNELSSDPLNGCSPNYMYYQEHFKKMHWDEEALPRLDDDNLDNLMSSEESYHEEEASAKEISESS